MTFHTLISVAQAQAVFENALFIDCRAQLGEPSWGSAQYTLAHIAGAYHADLERDLSSPIVAGVSGRHPLPSPEQLRRLFSGWGLKPGQQVIAYDQDAGVYGARLWWLLRAMGHQAVAVLDGGFAAWRQANGATDAHIPEPCSDAGFTGNWSAEVVSAEQMLAHSQTCDAVLVDVRGPSRYRGEEEPIDAKAGHIPGAINLPFIENIAAGHWRSFDELRMRFAPLEQRQVVAYCGSGVSACHHILAMVHAGLPEPQLYAGSWSEWIVDPQRPIALGNEIAH